jgi:hypothetical protein
VRVRPQGRTFLRSTEAVPSCFVVEKALTQHLSNTCPLRWCLGKDLLLPAVDLNTFARKGHDDFLYRDWNEVIPSQFSL